MAYDQFPQLMFECHFCSERMPDECKEIIVWISIKVLLVLMVTATQAVQNDYGGRFTHWVCVALSRLWKPGGALHLSCSFLGPVFFYVMTLLVEMNTSRDLLLAGCNTAMG